MIPILFEYNATGTIDPVTHEYETPTHLPNTHGLGDLVDATECKARATSEGEYELSFSYPCTGELFKELKTGRKVLAKVNDYDDPQVFRIYGIESDIKGMVTVNCQHISYDMAAYPVQVFKDKLSPAQVVSDVNINVISISASRAFAFELSAYGIPLFSSAMTYKRGDYVVYEGNTWQCIEDIEIPGAFDMSKWTVLEKFSIESPKNVREIMIDGDDSVRGFYGGDAVFDNYKLEIKKNAGLDRGTVIEYGVDLMELSQDQNITDMITGVFPYWKGNVKGAGVGQVTNYEVFTGDEFEPGYTYYTRVPKYAVAEHGADYDPRFVYYVKVGEGNNATYRGIALSDLDFKSGVTYYEAVEFNYIQAVDTSPVAGEQYYIYENGAYREYLTSDLDFKSGATYYEYIVPVNGSGTYTPTSDAHYDWNKTYYIQQKIDAGTEYEVTNYIAATAYDLAFKSGITVYQRTASGYVRTNDAHYQEGKSYYIATTNQGSFMPVDYTDLTFRTGVTYYAESGYDYKRVTSSRKQPGVIYYVSEKVEDNETYVYGEIQYADGFENMPDSAQKIEYLDLSEFFNAEKVKQIPTADALNRKARQWMLANDVGIPHIDLTLSYASLGQDVRLFDAITVKLKKLGIDVKAKVTSYTYDVLNDRCIEIEVSNVKSSSMWSTLEDASRLRKGLLPPSRIGKKSISGSMIGSGAIDSSNIASGGVSSENIAPDAVSETKIKDGAITYSKIEAGAVVTEHIRDGAVTGTKVIDQAISLQKLDKKLQIFYSDIISALDIFADRATINRYVQSSGFIGDIYFINQNGRQYSMSLHTHEFYAGANGTIHIKQGVDWTGGDHFFNIADTKFYKDAVSEAESRGGVARGNPIPTNASNYGVFSGSDLPAGSTEHKFDYNFTSGGGLYSDGEKQYVRINMINAKNEVIKTVRISTPDRYNAGVEAGYESVSITALGRKVTGTNPITYGAITYTASSNTYTIPIQASLYSERYTGPNGTHIISTSEASPSFVATDAFNAGKDAQWGLVTNPVISGAYKYQDRQRYIGTISATVKKSANETERKSSTKDLTLQLTNSSSTYNTSTHSYSATVEAMLDNSAIATYTFASGTDAYNDGVEAGYESVSITALGRKVTGTNPITYGAITYTASSNTYTVPIQASLYSDKYTGPNGTHIISTSEASPSFVATDAFNAGVDNGATTAHVNGNMSFTATGNVEEHTIQDSGGTSTWYGLHYIPSIPSYGVDHSGTHIAGETYKTQIELDVTAAYRAGETAGIQQTTGDLTVSSFTHSPNNDNPPSGVFNAGDNSVYADFTLTAFNAAGTSLGSETGHRIKIDASNAVTAGKNVQWGLVTNPVISGAYKYQDRQRYIGTISATVKKSANETERKSSTKDLTLQLTNSGSTYNASTHAYSATVEAMLDNSAIATYTFSSGTKAYEDGVDAGASTAVLNTISLGTAGAATETQTGVYKADIPITYTTKGTKSGTNNYYISTSQTISASADVTAVYEGAYKVGKNVGLYSASVSSVAQKAQTTPTHVASGINHYVEATVVGKVGGTLSDGSTYESSGNDISNVRINANAVWNAVSLSDISMSAVKDTSGGNSINNIAKVSASVSADNGKSKSNNLQLKLVKTSQRYSKPTYTLDYAIQYTDGNSQTTNVATLSSEVGTDAYNDGVDDGAATAHVNGGGMTFSAVSTANVTEHSESGSTWYGLQYQPSIPTYGINHLNVNVPGTTYTTPIEINVTKAYVAGRTAGASSAASDLTVTDLAVTPVSGVNPPVGTHSTTSIGKHTVRADFTFMPQHASGQTKTNLLENGINLPITIDATDVYNSGVDTGANTLAVTGVTYTVTNSHNEDTIHQGGGVSYTDHNIIVTLTGTAETTKSDGTKKTNSLSVTSQKIPANAVYEAGRTAGASSAAADLTVTDLGVTPTTVPTGSYATESGKPVVSAEFTLMPKHNNTDLLQNGIKKTFKIDATNAYNAGASSAEIKSNNSNYIDMSPNGSISLDDTTKDSQGKTQYILSVPITAKATTGLLTHIPTGSRDVPVNITNLRNEIYNAGVGIGANSAKANYVSASPTNPSANNNSAATLLSMTYPDGVVSYPNSVIAKGNFTISAGHNNGNGTYSYTTSDSSDLSIDVTAMWNSAINKGMTNRWTNTSVSVDGTENTSSSTGTVTAKAIAGSLNKSEDYSFELVQTNTGNEYSEDYDRYTVTIAAQGANPAKTLAVKTVVLEGQGGSSSGTAELKAVNIGSKGTGKVDNKLYTADIVSLSGKSAVLKFDVTGYKSTNKTNANKIGTVTTANVTFDGTRIYNAGFDAVTVSKPVITATQGSYSYTTNISTTAVASDTSAGASRTKASDNYSLTLTNTIPSSSTTVATERTITATAQAKHGTTVILSRECNINVKQSVTYSNTTHKYTVTAALTSGGANIGKVSLTTDDSAYTTGAATGGSKSVEYAYILSPDMSTVLYDNNVIKLSMENRTYYVAGTDEEFGLYTRGINDEGTGYTLNPVSGYTFPTFSGGGGGGGSSSITSISPISYDDSCYTARSSYVRQVGNYLYGCFRIFLSDGTSFDFRAGLDVR